jgi:hypothetical protein
MLDAIQIVILLAIVVILALVARVWLKMRWVHSAYGAFRNRRCAQQSPYEGFELIFGTFRDSATDTIVHLIDAPRIDI